jgi:hypothetical protein
LHATASQAAFFLQSFADYAFCMWSPAAAAAAVAVALQEKFAQIFSYASQHATDVDGGPDFMDDAIRIERCAKHHLQQNMAELEPGSSSSSSGSGDE